MRYPSSGRFVYTRCCSSKTSFYFVTLCSVTPICKLSLRNAIIECVLINWIRADWIFEQETVKSPSVEGRISRSRLVRFLSCRLNRFLVQHRWSFPYFFLEKGTPPVPASRPNRKSGRSVPWNVGSYLSHRHFARVSLCRWHNDMALRSAYERQLVRFMAFSMAARNRSVRDVEA